MVTMDDNPVVLHDSEQYSEGETAWRSSTRQRKETKEGTKIETTVDGTTNHVYDETPNEYDPAFNELIRERSSTSFSAHHVVVATAEVYREFNPGGVSRVSEDIPLKRSLPSSSSEERHPHIV